MTPPRFDRLAPHYAWIEAITFRGFLQHCRTALLNEVTDAKRALILGEGDGRFLAAFLAANPNATVDVLDGSAAMIARARLRVLPSDGQRLRWIVADARDFVFAPASYDLIVTNFFLDCFNRWELEMLIARLDRVLEPGGRWLVGDFAVPSGATRGMLARAALALMYAFFAVATHLSASRLVDPQPILLRHGLALEHQIRSLGGFLTASLWRRSNSALATPPNYLKGRLINASEADCSGPTHRIEQINATQIY